MTLPEIEAERVAFEAWAQRECPYWQTNMSGGASYTTPVETAWRAVLARAEKAASEKAKVEAELADAEQRVTNLHEARQCALQDAAKERDRADKAEARCRELERAKLHPAIAVDVQEHRTEAHMQGWDDGYAEGYGKASVQTEAALAQLEASSARERELEAEKAALLRRLENAATVVNTLSAKVEALGGAS